MSPTLPEVFYKGDFTLVWYISESNITICKTRILIFINIVGSDSSLEGRLTLFNTQEITSISEYQFINSQEDHNKEVVDEPSFHWVETIQQIQIVSHRCLVSKGS